MTALALAVYAVLLVAAAAAVWRRPLVALYVFVVGLALHNAAIDAFYGALYYRLLIDRGPMTRKWATEFVEIMFKGLVGCDHPLRGRKGGDGTAGSKKSTARREDGSRRKTHQVG